MHFIVHPCTTISKDYNILLNRSIDFLIIPAFFNAVAKEVFRLLSGFSIKGFPNLSFSFDHRFISDDISLSDLPISPLINSVCPLNSWTRSSLYSLFILLGSPGVPSLRRITKLRYSSATLFNLPPNKRSSTVDRSIYPLSSARCCS